MRKIIIYIATSLDGYIARPDGAIDWLPDPGGGGEDYGYYDFIQRIDTVLMGNNTYRQVRGFDIDYPYKEYKNYVFSRNKDLDKDEYVQFIKDAPIDFMRELKSKSGKDIWLVGGGEIVNLATAARVADELQLFIMPVVLGEGIPLFGQSEADRHLELTKSKAYNSGVLEMHYKLL